MAHKKIWHAVTNIGAINSKHTKIYDVTKKTWIVMKICDILLPNGMPCHHHITISCYYSPKVARMNGILLLPNFG
jgi:hypothetical protein